MSNVVSNVRANITPHNGQYILTLNLMVNNNRVQVFKTCKLSCLKLARAVGEVLKSNLNSILEVSDNEWSVEANQLFRELVDGDLPVIIQV